MQEKKGSMMEEWRCGTAMVTGEGILFVRVRVMVMNTNIVGRR